MYIGIIMDDTSKQEGGNVEPYDYGSDFLILTRKEKRGVLKNAQHLLKLQKENDAVFVDMPVSKKESEKN
jgi:hypothetical protein